MLLAQVPQFLLDEWLLNYSMDQSKTCEIVCTQPRRLSAIGVAERVADERVEKIGGTVGYQVSLLEKFEAIQFLHAFNLNVYSRFDWKVNSHLRHVFCFAPLEFF